jgi:hypothetical protein
MTTAIVPSRLPGHTLSKAEREAVIQAVYDLVLAGETRYTKIAEAVGIKDKAVARYVKVAHERLAAESMEMVQAARAKVASRFDYLYREALYQYAKAKAEADEHGKVGDPDSRRAAAETLKTATAIVKEQAKYYGLEDVPAITGDQFHIDQAVFISGSRALARRALAVGPIKVADAAPALSTSNDGEVIEENAKENGADAGAEQA